MHCFYKDAKSLQFLNKKVILFVCQGEETAIKKKSFPGATAEMSVWALCPAWCVCVHSGLRSYL